MTKIQWTDATWNPTRGCSGSVRFVANKLAEPLTWRKPRMVFVNSMSDLFHPSLENEEIAAVFGVMAACPQHTFQVLTKRPRRARHWFEWIQTDLPSCHVLGSARGVRWHAKQMLYGTEHEDDVSSSWSGTQPDWKWPLPNVWLGVSAGTQQLVEEFVPELEATPAAVRFVSAEPLLEWVGLGSRHIDWLIIGGESGPGARPCETEWIRRLLWECEGNKIAAFVKQLGSNTDVPTRDSKGGDPSEWPDDLRVRQMPAGATI